MAKKKSKKNAGKKNQTYRAKQTVQPAVRAESNNAQNVQNAQNVNRAAAKQPHPSDKPLYMRILMLTIAVVMVLGIVVGAVAGAAGIVGF